MRERLRALPIGRVLCTSVVGVVSLAAMACSARSDSGGPGMEPTPMFEASRGGEQEAGPRRGGRSRSRPPGAIERAELDQVLSAGIAQFLQAVSVREDLRDGRFVGYRITGIDREHAWAETVDLREGDTVVSVNGLPIERPEQAFRVWEELRVASELRVEYLRGGERRVLRFVIRE